MIQRAAAAASLSFFDRRLGSRRYLSPVQPAVTAVIAPNTPVVTTPAATMSPASAMTAVGSAASPVAVSPAPAVVR